MTKSKKTKINVPKINYWGESGGNKKGPCPKVSVQQTAGYREAGCPDGTPPANGKMRKSVKKDVIQKKKKPNPTKREEKGKQQ